MLRTTSVYSVFVAMDDVPAGGFLQKMVAATLSSDATLSESYYAPDGIVLRYRIAGGDVAALALFHKLVGTVPATLHTGVGVNRRPVN